MLKKYNKSIDISCLPRRGKCIDWINSIGYELNFTYGNISGVLEITDYVLKGKIKYIVLKYNNIEYSLQPTCLLQCSFGRMLKHELLEYKYNIGEVINTEKSSITIIDRFVVEIETDKKSVNQTSIMVKKYKYKCNYCGYEDIREEHKLDRACNACYKIPKKIVVGINDIPTTDPWMIPYFPNGYQEACKYNARSNKKIIMNCPYCNKLTKTKKSINLLYYHKGFKCECNDGISYPNKFSYELLNQLPVNNIIHEWNPDWLKPYYYDNYFEYNGKRYVLEMDGILGHGNRTWDMKKDITGKDKDNHKDNLAKEHSITVIRINAIKSSLDFIKNSIMQSELSKIFDLSNINWDECDKFACKNIIKIICEDKANNPKMLTSDFIKKYGLSRITIYKYLSIGNKYGWCNYDSNWNKGYIAFQKCKKPIICNDKYVFDSVRTVLEESENVLGVKLNEYSFRKILKENNPSCEFKFEYLDKMLLGEYINNKKYIFIKNKLYG